MIHFNKDWSLSGDENSITLYKRRINAEGEPQWDPKGYFQNFKDAYLRMVEMNIQPLDDLQKVVQAIGSLKNALSESIYACSLAFRAGEDTQGGGKMKLYRPAYHNTTHETGQTLLDSEEKAQSQEEKVLEYFQLYKTYRFTVHHINRKVLPDAPHHSCQRAVTNLTKAGHLTKTDVMKEEIFGVKVHTWILN